jgi:hypothetical protein
MSDNEHEAQEDRPRESEPNPTQERMDELGESESDTPVDVDWEEEPAS